MHTAALVLLVTTVSKFVLEPTTSSVPLKLRTVPCVGVKIPRLFPYYCILFLLLIGMWIYRRLVMGIRGGGLLQVFVRDGVWAFLTVFVIVLCKWTGSYSPWMVTRFPWRSGVTSCSKSACCKSEACSDVINIIDGAP
ncbi:hypothetical protein BU17DRAFT_64083 [Hysterangium stoloniferum]|nr:hypothetical protein BU17DRAFT_64083 [Hysterangium stoloniferum]